ncbi:MULTISPECIES: hypothetical protein [Streptomyces]|uniref:Uncharacterized protein n=1 Tax=Streptomyces canarius TaxID=285453 RepID=A0ABQ3CI45_9ACTN|nr:hypothetical protein [Streptomyces canarius]GHA17453.1 hypothetical protein GCM10010345_22590 [Streptomyces canarius]
MTRPVSVVRQLRDPGDPVQRDPHGGYRVVSREAPSDGAGNADWTGARFGSLSRAALDGTIPSDTLERAARAHFGLPADAPVGDCWMR